MPSESRPALSIQTEKPNHYSYLKEFRVEQCTQFLQHKCTNHRPFTCFHWHFNNQRRRRPVRKRDGSFNYSPDSYCTKYDETTGICPDGDDCPLLHRTAGDTERRYHLRYYKTCMCVHDTDSRGYCVKNGPHCAFAHGSNDLRPPVYDAKELQAMENADSDSGNGSNGPNVLDKERNLMNEDPKWQDTNYVLAYYKTEPCKRPPRLCRQGYACPQYHNSRDKRRSPRQFKYRSTPCPSVKHGDDWGETSSCDAGDMCAYCHTRTEQQFHPEIYKSTRCNDVQQSGYCPRGVFCAFAHVDQEMNLSREAPNLLELKTSLADILSSALPSNSGNQNDSRDDEDSHSSPDVIMQQHLSVNKDTLTEKLNSKIGKEKPNLLTFMGNDMGVNFANPEPHGSLGFYSNDTTESVLGNAFDDMTLDDHLALIDRDLDTDSPTANSITQGIASSVLGSSAPMNIPGGGGLGSRVSMSAFSPPTSSPLPALQTPSFLSGSAFQDPLDSNNPFMNHATTKIGSFPSSSGGGGGGSSSLFGLSSAHMSPTGGIIPGRSSAPQAPPPNLSSLGNLSPSIMSNSLSEIQRLREHVQTSRQVLQSWDERLQQARAACEAWKREAEEASVRANIADQQRNEALSQINKLRQELEKVRGDSLLHTLNSTSEAKDMPIHVLQSIQSKLKSDLDTIDTIIADRNKNNGDPLLNNRYGNQMDYILKSSTHQGTF